MAVLKNLPCHLSVAALAALTLCAPALADACSWCPKRDASIDCASDTSAPVITVYAADKAGSFYSDDFTIKGRISGACLKSAGIYEAETEVSHIAVSERSRRSSQEFEVTIDASQEPEIRAVSLSGRTRIYKIDVLDIRG